MKDVTVDIFISGDLRELKNKEWLVDVAMIIREEDYNWWFCKLLLLEEVKLNDIVGATTIVFTINTKVIDELSQEKTLDGLLNVLEKNAGEKVFNFRVVKFSEIKPHKARQIVEDYVRETFTL